MVYVDVDSSAWTTPAAALALAQLANEGSDATVPVGGPQPVPVSQLLGPILVGVLHNSFIYGIVALHWLQYTLGRNRDRRVMKYVL